VPVGPNIKYRDYAKVCAAAMRPFLKLLWTLVTILNVSMGCKHYVYFCRTAEPERVQRVHAVPAAYLSGVRIIPVSVL